METKYLKINPADNVAVAIVALPAGEKLIVDGKEIVLNEDVPAGHKFALQDFAEGENVIKYGYPIGHARTAKKQGDWMNENNIKTNLAGLLEYTYNPTEVNLDIPHKNLTFKGYRRKNGDVGVRNEIWIIPTVGCVNGIINQLAEGLRRETEGKGVDAIMAFPHNYGCSQLGDDHENTKKILRDMVLHPNAGAVLVVGLGCENNQPDVFREFLGEYDSDRVKFMVTQKVGDEYEEGMKLLRELYEKASKDERVDVPLSELRVGLKCGGSDGFSGITANPLLGMFSDFLIAQGGTDMSKYNIINMSFWDTYMSLGGSGCTLGLIIAIFLFSKRADYRAIAKLSVGPGIFEINECMTFGLPIVLNPYLVLPFIITPLINGTIGYFATKIGFAGVALYAMPWTTPPIISAWLSTGGSIGAVITQLICIVVSVVIYTPFVILANKEPVAEEA